MTDDTTKRAEALKRGDYVLATKYRDGDPGDQWCVGYYDHQHLDRHIVVDDKGQRFRFNGFRRCERISKVRGEFILAHIIHIGFAGRSLWYWKRKAMQPLPSPPTGAKS